MTNEKKHCFANKQTRFNYKKTCLFSQYLHIWLVSVPSTKTNIFLLHSQNETGTNNSSFYWLCCQFPLSDKLHVFRQGRFHKIGHYKQTLPHQDKKHMKMEQPFHASYKQATIYELLMDLLVLLCFLLCLLLLLELMF